MAAVLDSLAERSAPMQGPNRKPREKAIPMRAMDLERVAVSLRSVMTAIDRLTLAFEIPPIIRLIKNIMKTLETDQTRYEISVPVITNRRTGFLP